MRPWFWLAALAILVTPALVMAGDPPKVKDAGKTYQVPFRLTDSGHIMVRIKINGKGPYNFIVDTGAPLVYISVPVAKKVGLPTDKKEQIVVDKLELEGGPTHTAFKCLIDTPFQLEGMNALGLAGVELHGILGYTILAHYKMEIDLTRDKMTWTKLNYMPPAPLPIGKGGGAPGGLDMIGKFMKMIAAITGTKGAPDPILRGFVGIELAVKDKILVVQSVLPKSPAANAGLMPGDRIIQVKGKTPSTPAEVAEVLAGVTPGQRVIFVVGRGDATKEITVTLGEGL